MRSSPKTISCIKQPKSGVATSRSSCATDLHQKRACGEISEPREHLRCGILCVADPSQGWDGCPFPRKHLTCCGNHPMHVAYSYPRLWAEMALKLSSALLFELIRLPYGFGSSLLFAISYGIWRPGHSTLPLLHKLKEIFYGVIGLHGLQTTGASKVPLEGLSALSTPP